MDSRLAMGHAERSRIELAIREFDLSLSKISQLRLRLAVQLADCALFRQTLVRRKNIPPAGSSNRNRSRNGHDNRRIASR
jgi:hypothetical protein